jgi:hypothetical protein
MKFLCSLSFRPNPFGLSARLLPSEARPSKINSYAVTRESGYTTALQTSSWQGCWGIKYQRDLKTAANGFTESSWHGTEQTGLILWRRSVIHFKVVFHTLKIQLSSNGLHSLSPSKIRILWSTHLWYIHIDSWRISLINGHLSNPWS